MSNSLSNFFNQYGDLAIFGGAVVVGVLFYAVIMLFTLLISTAIYIFFCMPLYKMAQKAGYKSPWLAWIPLANFYILFMIPHRSYKLLGDSIKFDDRKKAFWCYIIIYGSFSFLSFILSVVMSLVNEIPDLGPIIYLVLAIIVIGFNFLVGVVMYVFIWRAIYDLLMTYTQKSTAIWVSIVSLFFYPLFLIYLWILRKNSPSYGDGNYYDYSIWDPS